jgi:TonB family protein
VRLKVLIGADGIVKRAHVVSSKPAGVFDTAALEAARHWHFNPGRNAKGQAVASYVIVPLVFHPKG